MVQVNTVITSARRVNPEQAVFFSCDIQHSCAAHMMNYPTMAKNAARLARVSGLLKIPMIATAHTKFGPIDPMVSE